MKFSALSVDFITDSLGSRRPAQVRVKDGYPLKSGYFTTIISGQPAYDIASTERTFLKI